MLLCLLTAFAGVGRTSRFGRALALLLLCCLNENRGLYCLANLRCVESLIFLPLELECLLVQANYSRCPNVKLPAFHAAAEPELRAALASDSICVEDVAKLLHCHQQVNGVSCWSGFGEALGELARDHLVQLGQTFVACLALIGENYVCSAVSAIKALLVIGPSGKVGSSELAVLKYFIAIRANCRPDKAILTRSEAPTQVLERLHPIGEGNQRRLLLRVQACRQLGLAFIVDVHQRFLALLLQCARECILYALEALCKFLI